MTADGVIDIPNPFPILDLNTNEGLRASIEKNGVIYPIVVDQHGRLIDGHQRKRIADPLGVHYETVVMAVRDDEHFLELALTLNLDRRHLTAEQRKRLVAVLRETGRSVRSIADELGVAKSTVHRDLDDACPTGTPDRVSGRDGKTYPAKKKPRRPRRRTKPAPAERPFYVRFAEAVGNLDDLLGDPGGVVAAIPDGERERWALTLHGLAHGTNAVANWLLEART